MSNVENILASSVRESIVPIPRPKITAEGASIRFGSVTAVEDFTTVIREREFVSIIGPSGCGKSTMLYAIAGFLKTTSGLLKVDDKPIVKPGPDRGIVFQEFVLFPWRTVLRNITLGPEIAGLPRDEAEERARKWIRMTGLGGFEDAYPATLSGGMKQRVAIARALTCEPDILLLDEPFGALDVQTKNYVMKDLQDLWIAASKTILMVTHSVQEATLMADRVLILGARPSKIVADVTIDLPHPRNPADPRLGRYRQEVTEILSAEVDRSMKSERSR